MRREAALVYSGVEHKANITGDVIAQEEDWAVCALRAHPEFYTSL
jgi:hypothetical protein